MIGRSQVRRVVALLALQPLSAAFLLPITTHRSSVHSQKPAVAVRTKPTPHSKSTILPMMSSPVLTPVLSLATMASVVLVHECGHYLTARLFRIKVAEFSVGMGPKLLAFRALGNAFALRAIPLGGYVRFAGEEDNDDPFEMLVEDQSKWLRNRPCSERALVLSGGIVFNFLLSYLLYLGIFVRMGYLQTNSLTRLAKAAYLMLSRVTKDTAAGLGQLLLALLRISNPSPSKLTFSGPVGIVAQGSNIATQHGTTSLVWFAADLSANLGFINALPIPVLDGGRLMFVLWEAVTGRKADKRVEEFSIGISAFLILWMVVQASLSELWGLFFA